MWPPIICNINNKISGRQPRKCVEVVQRFWDCSGNGKTKTDEQVPYCAGAQVERKSAHRKEGACSSVLVLPSHQQHPEDGDGVSHWNVGEILHPDAAVWPKISLKSFAAKTARVITLSNVRQSCTFFNRVGVYISSDSRNKQHYPLRFYTRDSLFSVRWELNY